MSAIEACAAPTDAGGWHEIPWRRVHRSVRKLQRRIAKAQREGHRGKVKALQRLLTTAWQAKALAVKRVTENRGRRTAGVDGETWSTPDAKWKAIRALRRQGYQPKPLRRVYIPKANGQQRPLGIPTMKDRAMQALHWFALLPVAETTGDRCSYGFRPYRATRDAIEHCFKILSRLTAPQWVLEGDIKGCFDHIDHAWMLDHIPMDKVVLRKWLKVRYRENGKLFPTTAGTPQGGILSPCLANMALDGLDRAIKERAGVLRPTGTINRKKGYKLNLVRYADDFIVTADTAERLETVVKPAIQAFLAERGLALSATKTRITRLDEGFDFLGWNVRRVKGKLLIRPSQRNLVNHLRTLGQRLNTLRSASQVNVISTLNPIVRGWANYHRHVVARAAFAKVGHGLWRLLWNWAKKRHPHKGKGWLRHRYFRTIRNFTWTFAGQTATGRLVYLIDPRMIPIRRHIMVKSDLNPFDPTFRDYLTRRREQLVDESGIGKRKALYQAQQGLCPWCQSEITPETGWHVHHCQPVCQGGSEEPTNLVLLHPNCHRQLHHSMRRASGAQPDALRSA